MILPRGDIMLFPKTFSNHCDSKNDCEQGKEAFLNPMSHPTSLALKSKTSHSNLSRLLKTYIKICTLGDPLLKQFYTEMGDGVNASR